MISWLKKPKENMYFYELTQIKFFIFKMSLGFIVKRKKHIMCNINPSWWNGFIGDTTDSICQLNRVWSNCIRKYRIILEWSCIFIRWQNGYQKFNMKTFLERRKLTQYLILLFFIAVHNSRCPEASCFIDEVSTEFRIQPSFITCYCYVLSCSKWDITRNMMLIKSNIFIAIWRNINTRPCTLPWKPL